MSNDISCQMTWNIKWHFMPNDMKCQMTFHAKWHEMTNDMRCQMSWDVKCHEMSNVIKLKVIQIYSNEQSHDRRLHKPRTEQRDAKPKGW